MSVYYKLMSVSKEISGEVNKLAESTKIDIDTIYGNYMYSELKEISTFKNGRLSEVLKGMGFEVGDSIYTEVTKDKLKEAGKKLLTELEGILENNIGNKIESEEIISEDTTTDTVGIVEILRGITECLVEVDFENEIILYEESL